VKDTVSESWEGVDNGDAETGVDAEAALEIELIALPEAEALADADWNARDPTAEAESFEDAVGGVAAAEAVREAALVTELEKPCTLVSVASPLLDTSEVCIGDSV